MWSHGPTIWAGTSKDTLALALRLFWHGEGRRLHLLANECGRKLICRYPSCVAMTRPIISSGPSNLPVPLAEDWGTVKLKKLAEQLRSYKAPANFLGEENSHERVVGITSSVGVPECAAVSKSDPVLTFAKKKAAVLICLFQNEEGDFRVVLTKRAKVLSSHSGEVALPGGKRDEEDADDTATALREAREEIGLDPSLVRVVTVLEPFLSKQLLRVTPVVVLLLERSKFKPIPNPGEVDAIFDAPLDMFLKDEQHRSEEMEWLGYTYRLHYFNFEFNKEKYLIWGLTAAILIRCASVIYQRPPAFVECHPDFASRTARQAPKL